MPYDLEMAALVAETCLALPGVQEVYLFGSVAKEGVSSKDIDLVLVTDEDAAHRFIVDTNWHCDRPYDPWNPIGVVGYRRRTAERELGGLVPSADRQMQLDVFLMPKGWQQRLAEGWVPFRYGDRSFMPQVAATARKYNQTTCSFEMASATE